MRDTLSLAFGLLIAIAQAQPGTNDPTFNPGDDGTWGDGVKGEASAEGAVTGEVGSSSSVNVFELDPPTYSYTQLLNRVVDFIHQNNPELTDKKRFTMKPPQLMRGNSLFVLLHFPFHLMT